jgi:putative Holliday junction resolvase
MRILGVDHGEKRIGIALSDASATIAAPLTVVQHRSRIIDAAQVASLARDHEVRLIVVGQSFDEHGQPNPAGRSAGRFAEALKAQTDIRVITWDEAFSTEDARAQQAALGVSRSKRGGHLDDLAAAVLLQSYLDARPRNP